MDRLGSDDVKWAVKVAVMLIDELIYHSSLLGCGGSFIILPSEWVHLSFFLSNELILIAGTLPPGGWFLFTMFPIKNPEEEDPPRSTWYKFFEGGPLPPARGSWLGNIVHRKPPRVGVFFQSFVSQWCPAHSLWFFFQDYPLRKMTFFGGFRSVCHLQRSRFHMRWKSLKTLQEGVIFRSGADGKVGFQNTQYLPCHSSETLQFQSDDATPDALFHDLQNLVTLTRKVTHTAPPKNGEIALWSVKKYIVKCVSQTSNQPNNKSW